MSEEQEGENQLTRVSSVGNAGLSSSSILVIGNLFISKRVNLGLHLVIRLGGSSSVSLLNVQFIHSLLKSSSSLFLSQFGLVERLGSLVLVTDCRLVALETHKTKEGYYVSAISPLTFSRTTENGGRVLTLILCCSAFLAFRIAFSSVWAVLRAFANSFSSFLDSFFSNLVYFLASFGLMAATGSAFAGAFSLLANAEAPAAPAAAPPAPATAAGTAPLEVGEVASAAVGATAESVVVPSWAIKALPGAAPPTTGEVGAVEVSAGFGDATEVPSAAIGEAMELPLVAGPVVVVLQGRIQKSVQRLS